MDYRRTKKVIFFAVVLFFGFVVANQFVVKKKKTPSTSTLKEQCCECHADLLRIIPDLMHALADVQTEACAAIREYMESDKKSFYQNASKKELIKYHSILHDLYDSCEKFKIEIVASMKKINQLKNI